MGLGVVASAAVAAVFCLGTPVGHCFNTVRPDNDGRFERPKVVIIIDDLGYDLNLARKFFSVGLPITLAIIPYSPRAASIGVEAAALGYETLAHIPMEPRDFPETDPGPGALLLNMDAEGIEDAVECNLRRVPGAQGVSNHMGSAFTENPEKMEILLRELKLRGMYFLDSITSPRTVGRKVAGSLGVRFAGRDIFLDNETGPEAIEKQFELLFEIAEREGVAVGIGHPYPETIEVLSRYRDELLMRFDLVPVSNVVKIPVEKPCVDRPALFSR